MEYHPAALIAFKRELKRDKLLRHILKCELSVRLFDSIIESGKIIIERAALIKICNNAANEYLNNFVDN